MNIKRCRFFALQFLILSLIREGMETPTLLVPNPEEMKSIEQMVQSGRKAFKSRKTIPYEFRLTQLKQLRRLLLEGKDEICQGLAADTRKTKFECLLEIAPALLDINYQIQHLKSHLRDKRTKISFFLSLFGMDTFTRREPYGLVTIIGTWNAPMLSLIVPLVGAIAGGNCAILRNSELIPHTAAAIGRLVKKYLDNDCYHSFVADGVGAAELLNHKLDYIFFTGSPRVGRLVLEAAAKHLTPVTLELGGKNPVYICDSSDVELAAERILLGKILNCGQLCVGPDYILCSESVKTKFVEVAPRVLSKWYGQGDWKKLEHASRIINKAHFHRLLQFLKNGEGRIAVGGDYDEADNWISPTIIVDVERDNEIMQSEIFGPIIPIFVVQTAEEALNEIVSRPKPLAAYIFTRRKDIQKEFIQNIHCGGICVNEVMLQGGRLPFGGVGESGMGRIKETFSFETFTHEKSVAICGQNPVWRWFRNKLLSSEPDTTNHCELVDFGLRQLSIVRALFDFFSFRTSDFVEKLVVFILGMVTAFLCMQLLYR